MIVIESSIPPAILHSGNTRACRMAQAAATKKWRGRGMAYGLVHRPPAPFAAARVQCHFTFKVKRIRDKDGLLTRMKAFFDGLADAGIVANDCDFTHLPIRIAIDRAALPHVRVEITEGSGDD